MLNKVLRLLIGSIAMLLFAQSAQSATCVGKFANPITDVCWDCIFPMSIGNVIVAGKSGDDIENPSNPICICKLVPPIPGITIGFWEPVMTFEAVRSPYCLVSLGGLTVDAGIPAVPHDRQSPQNEPGSAPPGWSKYQVHLYDSPWLYILGVGFDNVCQSTGSFDVGFMSEFDPSWEDDVAAMIVNPEAVLFANPAAIAACLADCGKANVNFGLKEMFWCAGCNGSLYPLNGNVQSQVSATQASSLLMQRLTLKLHRLAFLKRYHGFKALCGPVKDPIMDKRAYKSHMTYPIPYTSGVQPLGRTTVVWGAGKEYPFKGEDFAFLMFRKRNCCAF